MVWMSSKVVCQLVVFVISFADPSVLLFETASPYVFLSHWWICMANLAPFQVHPTRRTPNSFECTQTPRQRVNKIR